jgi:1-deoxy-D-xylulose-5-phosphate reductoisomerase
VRPLDLLRVGRLDFERPDLERFPCLALAYRALKVGATAPAVLNAANEVAVARVSSRGGCVSTGSRTSSPHTLDAMCEMQPADSLESVLEADRRARPANFVRQFCQ